MSKALIMALALIMLLAIATLIAWYKRVQHPERNYDELILRIKSWWWMIGIVLAAIYTGQKTTTVLFAFISFLALKEFYSITPLRTADRRLIFWAYLAIPVQYYLAYIQWYGMFIIFIPVYMFLFLPMRATIIGETKGFIKANATIQWSLMLAVFTLSHLAYLANLGRFDKEAGFMGLVLFLLFITQSNDVSQYVFGKTFGKHKILPKVSPNKTWEGFIGGIVMTSLFAMLLAPPLTVLSWQQGVIAGMLIAGAGFVGDVVLSSVKRDIGVKDTGTLLPGHGGLLDRVDSLMYATPLFFHYFYYIT